MSESELFVRGLMDTLIEDQLTDDSLDITHKMFERLKPTGAIRSDRRDAVFGFVVGSVVAKFFEYFRRMYNRSPNDKEVELSVDVFHKRMLRIKSRIDETFT